MLYEALRASTALIKETVDAIKAWVATIHHILCGKKNTLVQPAHQKTASLYPIKTVLRTMGARHNLALAIASKILSAKPGIALDYRC